MRKNMHKYPLVGRGIDPCTVTIKDILSYHYVGSGQTAHVVKDPKTNMVYKLVWGTDCDNVRISSETQLDAHNILAQLEQYQHNWPYTQLTYVPKPYCYADISDTLTYLNSPIKCIYSMEYIPPLDIGTHSDLQRNVYQGNLIQIHLAQLWTVDKTAGLESIGFSTTEPNRGYFMGNFKGLCKLLDVINSNYPQSKPLTGKQVMSAIGYICACIIFLGHYVPTDIQFFLGLHNGQVKIICFDMDFFSKVASIDNDDVLDEIAEALTQGMYLGPWFQYIECGEWFIDELTDTVQALISNGQLTADNNDILIRLIHRIGGTADIMTTSIKTDT
jgi:hypothetical protein